MVDSFLKKSNYGMRLAELEDKVQEIYSEGIEIGDTYDEKVGSFFDCTWKPYVIFASIYLVKNPIPYLEYLQEIIDNSRAKVSLKEAFKILASLQDVFTDALLDYLDYEEDVKEDILKTIKENDYETFSTNVCIEKEKSILLRAYCYHIGQTGLGIDSETFFDKQFNSEERNDNSLESQNEFYDDVEFVEYNKNFYEATINTYFSYDVELKKKFETIYKSFLIQMETSIPNTTSTEERLKWIYEQCLLPTCFGMMLMYNLVKTQGSIREFTILRKILCNPTFSYFSRRLIEQFGYEFGLGLVTINDNLFSSPTEGSKDEYFYNLHPAVVEGGVEKLSQLLEIYRFPNESNHIEFQTFVYRLTGRMRPDLYTLPQIEIGPKDADYFVYLINGLVVEGTEKQDVYSKIKSFFKGADFPDKMEDVEYNIPDDVLQELSNIYPGIFSKGAPKPIISDNQVSEDVEIRKPDYFYIPDDLFSNPDYNAPDFTIGRTLKSELENLTGISKRLQGIIVYLSSKGYIDHSYQAQHSLLMAFTSKAINKHFRFEKVNLRKDKAAPIISQLIHFLSVEPDYDSLGELFIPYHSDYKWRSYGNRYSTEVKNITSRFFSKK